MRRFIPQTTQIVKLIPGDVGRSITDLVSDLDHTDLANNAPQVLRTLVHTDKPVAARTGRWFNARIMPCRTTADGIDGVVNTFADIPAGNELEAGLRATQVMLDKRVAEQRIEWERKRGKVIAGHE